MVYVHVITQGQTNENVYTLYRVSLRISANAMIIEDCNINWQRRRVDRLVYITCSQDLAIIFIPDCTKCQGTSIVQCMIILRGQIRGQIRT